MKSPSLKFRVFAVPLVALAISCALVGQQYARRNRFERELKEAQAKYTRLSKEMKSVPASSSSLFSESKEHTHSDEDEAHPNETKPPQSAHP